MSLSEGKSSRAAPILRIVSVGSVVIEAMNSSTLTPRSLAATAAESSLAVSWFSSASNEPAARSAEGNTDASIPPHPAIS